jgi:DNA modification methylase
MELNKIYNMDCLEGLKQIDTGTIDLIASDPPYQLSPTGKGVVYNYQLTGSGNFCEGREAIRKGFMGKEWDILPSVDILKECLRVLKDGAFAFWLMTPRQDSQLEFLLRLREAGFIISFTPLYWTYFSGMPKALNIQRRLIKNIEIQLKEKHGINEVKWADE